MEGGSGADDLGVKTDGGGLITLAFKPVLEGDSWDYRGDKQYLKISNSEMWPVRWSTNISNHGSCYD